jgi:hypothetical protein
MANVWTRPSLAKAHFESLFPDGIGKATGTWYPDLPTLAGLVETLKNVDQRI